MKPFLSILALCLLVGCLSTPTRVGESRAAMAERIAAEVPGDYFIGRRYHKANYYFWGYVRRPGHPWSTAVLVILNEKQKLAPDRMQLGMDGDDFEYLLRGHFSGDKVYELVSDRFYPEFVLTDYELISTHPAPIFPSQISGRPATLFRIERPE